eukprot:gene14942-31730_t
MALIVQNLKHVSAVIGACNLAGFTATALFETHKITDLVGVGAFVAATVSLQSRYGRNPLTNLRLTLINGAVIAWGARLSGFLFYRVLKLGDDKRLESFFKAPGEGFLDSSKSFFPLKLASFWAIQSAWGIVCMLPVTLVNSLPAVAIGPVSAVAVACVATGLIIEGIADWQKYKFKEQNKDRWCDVGLWSLSRHPNYFGELLTWWSLYALALPALGTGHKLLALASPAFISSIILYLSGVPILEKLHQRKYGDNAEFRAYKERTNLLLPVPKFLQQEKDVRKKDL